MQFNTYLFILAVFPITVVCYFLLNKIRPFLGKAFLVVMSIWFYGYAGIAELKWLLLSIVANYLVVILGQKVRKYETGNVVAEYTNRYSDLDDEWHMYAIDLAGIEGKVSVILNGNYVDDSGAEDSEFAFRRIKVR